MRHILFGDSSDNLSIALLIKESSFNYSELLNYYYNPIENQLPRESIVAFTLEYDDIKKVKATTIKSYLQVLLKALDSLNITTLLVADSNYFKTLTGERKAEPHYGYVKPCKIVGYEHMEVILSANYQGAFYNPAVEDKISMSLNTLVEHTAGRLTKLGEGIIHCAEYPAEYESKIDFLQRLFEKPALTCDIEATSLRFDIGILSTIAFAWNQHEGGAFIIDESIRGALKEFFIKYPGTLWFHNALFDVKFLVYHLFMETTTDYEGMRQGIQVFTRVQDTMLLTYLAANSTAEIKLGLKDASFEFTGNYALDNIQDITKIDEDVLLEYNLKDCLATWFVHDKHLPTVLADNQFEVYEEIFQPSIPVLLEMMLIGLPMDLGQVDTVRLQLEAIRNKAMMNLSGSDEIHQFEFDLQLEALQKKNSQLKRTLKTISDFEHIRFNPGSSKQKQKLLYQRWGLNVLDLTDNKDPATGAKTLAKHLANETDPERIKILESMIELAKVDIILNTFISNFIDMAFTRDDGTTWLNGNLKLGGTQSGRLSSNNPNLQNIPSGSTYAKLIKSCFVAPEGWLFCGSDFSALEDRIGAVLSGDPMKTKEFSENADGHSLRAIAFFSKLKEKVTIRGTYIDPEVVRQYDITDVKSINQFKKDHPKIRDAVKPASFALQYGGTWKTLVTNIGLPEDVAKAIEDGYHELYGGLGGFTQNNTEFAADNGFVECAFGLRLRTPVLAKCLLGSRATPYEALSEGRSASNAVTQSWGMLMNRALIATRKRLIGSGFEDRIFFMNTIHDAGYALIKKDPAAIKWFNDTFIEEMNWNEHPLIQSEKVPLLANLDIGPSWDKQYELPNNISVEEIKTFMYKKGLLEPMQE